MIFISTSYAALRVETFNVGLARGFVDYAQQRLPKVEESLKGSQADVLCLQEVWSTGDRERLAAALRKSHPHIYMTPVYQTPTSSRPSCMPWQIFGEGKFVSCMNSQCSEASGDDFTDCIIQQCGESLERLKKENRDCASALMAKVGKNPILAILQLLNPFYRSGLFAYRGSNGLILASKRPLKNKELLDMSDISTLNRRQALSASIEDGEGDIRVVCAHLTANLNVPYTGKSENWARENYRQAERLIAETSKDKRIVLTGDFNCSLQDGESGVAGELEKTCRLLKARFNDPLSGIGECTFCSQNTLNSDDISDVALDHIYLRGLSPTRASVTRKEKVTIESEDGEIKTNLSDHYGFEVIAD